MSVTFPPEFEQYITDKVASGLYPTDTAVIREALLLLKAQDVQYEARREELGRLLDVGIADIEAGRTVPLTRELIESIKAEGRQRQVETQRHA